MTLSNASARSAPAPLARQVVAVFALVLVEVEERQTVVGEDTAVAFDRKRVIAKFAPFHRVDMRVAAALEIARREQERAAPLQETRNAGNGRNRFVRRK